MELSILIGQFPVSLDIHKNLEEILMILKNTQENDLVVFPEGCVSGYDRDLSFLENVDNSKVQHALEVLKRKR